MWTAKKSPSIYSFFVILLGTAAFLSSCSIPNDQVLDGYPDAKVFTSVITTANSGIVNTIDSVKTTDGIVKIELDVTVTDTNSINYIYIVKSSDNGMYYPIQVLSISNTYGTFTAGTTSTYSLKVPNLSRFVLDIPMAVRNTSTAKNDVYKIWLTHEQGSFNLPAYERTLGLATVNLLYSQDDASQETYAIGSVTMGSQSASNYGNYLVATGDITTLDSTSYFLSPQSVDMTLVTLTNGKKDNNSTELWLYSPADVLAANPAVSGQDNFVLPATGTSKTTLFDAYTGSISFDSTAMSAATLEALPPPTKKSINVIFGSTYLFQTQEGKKGLIKILYTGATTSIRGTGSTTAQNLSASIKVLN